MTPSSDAPPRWVFRVGLAAVIVAAGVAACTLFQHHRETYRQLWVSCGHDRNAHYRYGSELAADLRAGQFVQFASDFEKGSIVWPPLHGVLLATVILVGGRDPTLAVVPSLVGWAVGAVFAYLLANRAASKCGPLAGLVAAGLVLASPSFRAYAADCMLESLGGCLTLAVLWTYLRWEQDRTATAARWFGLALSLLFFQKFNFWLMAVAACGVTHFVLNWREMWAFLKRAKADIPWRAWLLAQLRHPLAYPIAILLGVCVSVWLLGGYTVPGLGIPITLRTASTLITIVYALVLLQLTIWWWTGGQHVAKAWLGDHRFPLCYWHLTPVLVWFLIPLRITTFVWFLSPANTERTYHDTFADTAAFFWDGFVREYAGSPTGAWAVVALAAVALLAVAWPGAYRRGGWVVPLFAVIGVLLTLRHPNHKLRFLFTPAAGLWAAAGVGVAVMGTLFERSTRPWVTWAVAGVLAVGVGVAVFPLVGTEVITGEPGYKPDASLRDLTDVYLDELTADDRPAVFGSHPSKFWAKWSYLERFGHPDRLQTDFREAGEAGPPSAELFARWCAVTRCDVLVFIQIEPGGPLDEPNMPEEANSPLPQLVRSQTTFTHTTTIPVPGRGTVSIWRRP